MSELKKRVVGGRGEGEEGSECSSDESSLILFRPQEGSVETPAGANSIGKPRQEPSRAASHLSPWHAGVLVLFRNRSIVQSKESAMGTSLLVHAIAIGQVWTSDAPEWPWSALCRRSQLPPSNCVD